jgi:hypothetical protein
VNVKREEKISAMREGERERKRNGNWLLHVLRIVRSSFVLSFAA